MDKWVKVTPPKNASPPPLQIDDTPDIDMIDKSKVINGSLIGLKFVITGVFRSMHRSELEEFIKTNKGRIQSGVSRNTDFVVTGEMLEDGREVTQGKKY